MKFQHQGGTGLNKLQNTKIQKCVQFCIDNMILSRTQHINHITHLVAVNELYDTTVTCLTQFADSTSYTNIIQLCNKLNLIINSIKYIRKIIKPIILNYIILVHKIPNIFTNSGVTVMHGIPNNSTK